MGTHVFTKQKVALKLIELKENCSERDRITIEREIKIMKLLKHENITQLFEVIEIPEKKTTCLVLELVTGGELFDYIIANTRLDEKEAIRLFRQMISAIEYTHNNLVIHRDLKPENILLDSELNVKISDFGLSNLMNVGSFMMSVCGSPHYTPPELHLKQPYIGPEVDVWALGVILFAMVCGFLPWGGSTFKDQMNNLIQGKYSVPNYVSPECKHLLSRMLSTDPKARCTVEEIRLHPWVSKGWKTAPTSNLPIRISLKPQEMDQDILLKLISLGFTREEVTRDLMKNDMTKQSVVMYYLFQDHKVREVRKSSADKLTRRASDPEISRTYSTRMVRPPVQRSDSVLDIQTVPPKDEVQSIERSVSGGDVEDQEEPQKSRSFMKMVGVQLSKRFTIMWKGAKGNKAEPKDDYKRTATDEKPSPKLPFHAKVKRNSVEK